MGYPILTKSNYEKMFLKKVKIDIYIYIYKSIQNGLTWKNTKYHIQEKIHGKKLGMYVCMYVCSLKCVLVDFMTNFLLEILLSLIQP